MNEDLKGLLDSLDEEEGFRDWCSSLCAELRESFANYDWIGIYWLKGDTLHLGPWSGAQATEHTKIPVSEGICGAAVREGKTVVVDDVSKDERYLTCFLETKSEIVVPIFRKGKIIGEIDIDGRQAAAYTDKDREFLEALAVEIGNRWPGKW